MTTALWIIVVLAASALAMRHLLRVSKADPLDDLETVRQLERWNREGE